MNLGDSSSHLLTLEPFNSSTRFDDYFAFEAQGKSRRLFEVSSAAHSNHVEQDSLERVGASDRSVELQFAKQSPQRPVSASGRAANRHTFEMLGGLHDGLTSATEPANRLISQSITTAADRRSFLCGQITASSEVQAPNESVSQSSSLSQMLEGISQGMQPSRNSEGRFICDRNSCDKVKFHT